MRHRNIFSRRRFGKAVGSVTAAAYIPGGLQSTAAAQARPDYYHFPANFVWACASASYQVEGAAAEDGRKPSVWDTYARTPGKVANGDTGDVADDSYHRYKEDIGLLKSLGVKAYRFSVAWPRVFPDGTGQANEKGIAYYERVVDELLANGIEPYATLFHWDLPQALEDRFGGWQSQETSKAFAEYAAYVAKRLSDRVHRFFTINEFSCFTDEGYGTGTKAPGKRLPARQLNQVRHNAVLGHGLGAQAIRAAARPGTKVGLAENPQLCVPVIESPQHVEAARKAMRELNAQFLTAILEGSYTERYLRMAGRDAPKFTAAEMKIIGSPLDFVGLNIYSPTHVRADGSKQGFAVVPHPASYPHMASSWLFVGPQIAYWGPRHLAEIWKVKDVYITENGCSSDDRVAADGNVYDTDRVMYVRNHLVQAHRAVSEGWPLRGYFLWSLMDNFEWADGYGKRFGLYYVDFKTQKRLPKLSAAFYRESIARNAVA
jgi:beta-glucosidase